MPATYVAVLPDIFGAGNAICHLATYDASSGSLSTHGAFPIVSNGRSLPYMSVEWRSVQSTRSYSSMRMAFDSHADLKFDHRTLGDDEFGRLVHENGRRVRVSESIDYR